VITRVYFPLPFPFIFTASGNVLTTAPEPVEDLTLVLRPEVKTHLVAGDSKKILKPEIRTHTVQGQRYLKVRRQSRMTRA
jgi:hypothetical protein